MIRGAVVLAVGFSLGYAKAMHESEDIRALLTQAVDLLQEQKRKADQPKSDIVGTVIDIDEGE